MGFGVAFTRARGREIRALTLGVILAVASAPILAETPAQIGVEMPAPPPSDSPHGQGVCAVPGATSTIDAPLPHLAALLRESREVRVLAIGSSSTVGLGASSPRATYPVRLASELEAAFRGLDVEIINRGVSGEMAAATARRLRVEVALHQPDLVLWQVGTNDALARVDPDEFRQTITETVRWLRENDTDVVLVGLQYTRSLARDAHYSRIKEVLREIAAQEGVPLVRRYEAMQYIEQVRDRENLLAEDSFHLNDLGYRCMAEHVARAIVSSVFVRPRNSALNPAPQPGQR